MSGAGHALLLSSRELEAEGWLEHTHSEGQVKFYRLCEMATGREVIVSLRNRPTA
ncbi:hypothetical protein ACFCX7_26240 [Streptomyces microflavus]|uniref:hypothetical protein n=1 Tax=Streptomyces microflavus TaxID=1919 RepID=UPI0035DF1916